MKICYWLQTTSPFSKHQIDDGHEHIVIAIDVCTSIYQSLLRNICCTPCGTYGKNLYFSWCSLHCLYSYFHTLIWPLRAEDMIRHCDAWHKVTSLIVSKWPVAGVSGPHCGPSSLGSGCSVVTSWVTSDPSINWDLTRGRNVWSDTFATCISFSHRKLSFVEIYIHTHKCHNLTKTSITFEYHFDITLLD